MQEIKVCQIEGECPVYKMRHRTVIDDLNTVLEKTEASVFACRSQNTLCNNELICKDTLIVRMKKSFRLETSVPWIGTSKGV